MGSISLLREIFPTQGSNPGLSHCRWIFLPAEPPGKPQNTRVDSLSLLQGIFPIQELNQGLLHCRWIFYQLTYQEIPCSIPKSGRSAGEGIGYPLQYFWGFSCDSAGKESVCNVGDLGLIPGLGRSREQGGNKYPLQYSGLENSMDYSPWSRKESDTAERLSYFIHT